MSSTTGVPNQVYPLRYIVRHCPLTTFEISVTNSDGTRKTDTQMEIQQELAKAGGKKKKGGPISQGPKSNALKIQFLLDQRKPPTEKLPSLCAQYDDDLNRMVAADE